MARQVLAVAGLLAYAGTMSAMRRAIRYLLEPGDLSLVRSWSGIVLGTSFIGLPVLFGMLDLLTCLIASLVGAILSLLFWRQIVDPSSGRRFLAFLVLFMLGAVGFARNFGGLAGFAYVGALIFVLSVMRLATGWRDPPNSSTWGA